MAISTNKNEGLFTEINITPLTDIFLVLLIIMMVIAPKFQSSDQSIKMPEINNGASVEESMATISVTSKNEFFINSKKISSDNIADELKEVLPKLKEKNVIVKADGSVKSSEIMKIMTAAKDAGYEKLTVAGEPLNKTQEKELEKNS